MSKKQELHQGLGSQFQEKRLASGYTFEDLATLLNEIVGGVGKFSAAEMEAWERDGADLANPRVFAMAHFFGIDLNSILKDVRLQAKK